MVFFSTHCVFFSFDMQGDGICITFCYVINVPLTRKRRFDAILLPRALVGICMKTLAEYYQMNTNTPGFQSFFSLFTLFHFEQISNQ